MHRGQTEDRRARWGAGFPKGDGDASRGAGRTRLSLQESRREGLLSRER